MLKAIFIDYMGTAVLENSPEMTELVRRICKNSDIHDPKQVMQMIVRIRRKYEADSYLDTYLTEDEIAERILSDMEAQIHLKEGRSVLHELVRGFWVNAPVYPDTTRFFKECPLPIYIITNNGQPYMEQAIARNGLRPAGIISADTARAYKPHREIFDEALRVSGCVPDEAIHIGDSYSTDVVGARSAGIRPLLLLRGKKRQYDDVDMADNLAEALEQIKAELSHI